jgi:hypothetical protein
MVPITAQETGRVAFLADRRPWSVRRFLLAFQRCGNGISGDRGVAQRVHRHSTLRDFPLEGEASYQTLVGLLSEPALKARLEETFWVDSRDEPGKAAAFEIAGTILSGNTGLRDTALALPTVAEANRLLRDGERFALEETHCGLFNAIRLVPDPPEGPERCRRVIRTVLRLGAP